MRGLSPHSLPLIVGTTVYIRMGDDLLRGYDLASGAETFASSSRIDATATPSYSDSFPVDLGLGAGGDVLVVPYRGKVVAYGSGTDTAGMDPDPWAMPSAVRLSLAKPQPARVHYGQRTVLTATYVRTVGEESGPRVLHLDADPFPSTGAWTEVAEDTDLGSFRPRPTRNTRYRVRYEGVRPAKVTRSRTVYTDLPFHVAYDYVSRTRLHARSTLRGPVAAVGHRKVALYFYRRSANHSRLLKTVILSKQSPARASTVLHVRRPSVGATTSSAA